MVSTNSHCTMMKAKGLPPLSKSLALHIWKFPKLVLKVVFLLLLSLEQMTSSSGSALSFENRQITLPFGNMSKTETTIFSITEPYSTSTRQPTFSRMVEPFLMEFVRSLGVCQTDNFTPWISEISCQGRCGQIGTFNRDIIKCSCDINCIVSGDCCADFLSKCVQTFTSGRAKFTVDLGLISACMPQDVSVVYGFGVYDSIEADVHLNFRRLNGSRNATGRRQPLSSEVRQLRDYLGHSSQMVGDLKNGVFFRNMETYSNCEIQDSKPVYVPRKVDLACSTVIDLSEDTSHGTNIPNLGPETDPGDWERIHVTRLDNFLQGCNVIDTSDVVSPQTHTCMTSSSINCYSSDTPDYTSVPLSELCAEMEVKDCCDSPQQDQYHFCYTHTQQSVQF